MSLVGPRPLPLRDYELLEDGTASATSCCPGMTGLWQISGRSNLSFDDLVRLDFYYLDNWSIWLDIAILAQDDPRGDPAARRVLTAVSSRSRWRAILAAVRAPKILAVASAVDLDFRYGCTPAWWQLWKGLYEAGVDLIVTPYRGRPVESPWWRTEPNPCYREGESSRAARDAVARLKGDTLPPPRRGAARRTRAPTGSSREAIWRWVTPRWQRHLERILERERTSTRSSSSPCR